MKNKEEKSLCDEDLPMNATAGQKKVEKNLFFDREKVSPERACFCYDRNEGEEERTPALLKDPQTKAGASFFFGGKREV